MQGTYNEEEILSVPFFLSSPIKSHKTSLFQHKAEI